MELNVFVCTNKKCPKVKDTKNQVRAFFTEPKAKELDEHEIDYLRAVIALIRFKHPATNRKFVGSNILTIIKRHLADEKKLQNFEFEVKSLELEDVNHLNTQHFKARPIKCHNPKLVICQNGYKISIIKLPDYKFDEKATSENPRRYQNIRLVNIPPKKKKDIKTYKTENRYINNKQAKEMFSGLEYLKASSENSAWRNFNGD